MTDGASEADEGSRDRMATAIREIRREAWKAAVTAAVVEAAAVFLGANLVLAALDPSWLPDRLVVPGSVTEQVGSALGRDPGTVAFPGSATVAAGVGALAFAVAVWLRVRKPLVEQFEAVNPAVAEKLRTARDAVEADADSRMARRLYGEVLADLRDSSAVGLLNAGRLVAAAVVVAALSLATVQMAVVDLALFDRGQPATDGGATDERTNYTGLLDGDRVLGDREEVSAGDDNQTAEIESSGGGRDAAENRTFPDRDPGGAGGTAGGVDSQQAGFAAPEQVENADLVREYNRRIRDNSGSTAGGDGTGSDETGANDDDSGTSD